MVAKKTPSIDLNIYLAAAESLGYEVQVLNAEVGYAAISHAGKTLFLYKNCLSLNDQVAVHFSIDKYLSGVMLTEVVPEFIPQTIQLQKSDADAIARGVAFAEKHNFSVVLKPNDASLGAGVHLLPKDASAVTQILTELFKEYQTILVQKYLSGKREYRVVYAKGRFFDAVQRIPAAVMGDGTHTIEELVAIKNQTRDSFGFPLLVIDAGSKAMLSEKKLDVTSVLSAGESVTLKNVCTFAQGGETVRVPLAHIHSKFLEAFEKVAKHSRLQFIGIDVMCEDIAKDPESQSAGINEINSAPMADLHYFADLQAGEELESTKRLLQMIV